MFCWFFRLAISHTADADKPLSAVTKKHINRCTHCREFYRLCRAMSEDLTRQAAALSCDTPATLAARILRNVASKQKQSPNIRIRPALSLPNGLRPIAVAACIALVALAGFFFLVRQRYNQRKNQINETVATFRNLVGKDLSSGLARLIEKPLTGELQHIVDDSESAAHFLFTCVAVPDARSSMLNDNGTTR